LWRSGRSPPGVEPSAPGHGRTLTYADCAGRCILAVDMDCSKTDRLLSVERNTTLYFRIATHVGLFRPQPGYQYTISQWV
jgi:hypothetical protein